MTGVDVENTVKNAIKKCNLNLSNWVAITTDGCSTMVSELRGGVETVMEEAPNAVVLQSLSQFKYFSNIPSTCYYKCCFGKARDNIGLCFKRYVQERCSKTNIRA